MFQAARQAAGHLTGRECNGDDEGSGVKTGQARVRGGVRLPRLQMIWPMQEMARSFTSWSMSAAFSRLMVQVNRSLMYGEGSKESEPSDWLSRGRIT